jgi:hypothetical protein
MWRGADTENSVERNRGTVAYGILVQPAQLGERDRIDHVAVCA